MRRLIAIVLTFGVFIATTALGALAVAAPPTGAATSNTPIVVGGEGDLAIAPGLPKGFIAGIYRFNKAGGLDGRQIKFVGFLDSQYSPATGLTNLQQLVLNDHVTAVAPLVTVTATQASGQYLAAHSTPFVGWATGLPYTGAPKWGYGINGLQINYDVQGLSGVKQILAATGNTKNPSNLKLALVGLNYPSGVSADNAIAGVATHAGVKVVYNQASVPVAGTTNYAPYAQAVVSSGANAVYEVLSAPTAVGLAQALKSAGFKGTIVNGVTYLPGELASNPNEESALQGVYVESEFPVDENNTAATKQAEKDLASTGSPPYLTSDVSEGYWSAIMLEQMLRATLKSVGGNPDKVTAAAIGKEVNNGFAYTDPIAGGIGNVYFPAAETIPTGCGTLVKTVGSQFKLVEPYVCAGAVNVVTGKTINEKTGKPSS